MIWLTGGLERYLAASVELDGLDGQADLDPRRPARGHARACRATCWSPCWSRSARWPRWRWPAVCTCAASAGARREWFLLAWTMPPVRVYTLVHFGQAGYVLTFLPALVILLLARAGGGARGAARACCAAPAGAAALTAAAVVLVVLVNGSFFVSARPLPRDFDTPRADLDPAGARRGVRLDLQPHRRRRCASTRRWCARSSTRSAGSTTAPRPRRHRAGQFALVPVAAPRDVLSAGVRGLRAAGRPTAARLLRAALLGDHDDDPRARDPAPGGDRAARLVRRSLESGDRAAARAHRDRDPARPLSVRAAARPADPSTTRTTPSSARRPPSSACTAACAVPVPAAALAAARVALLFLLARRAARGRCSAWRPSRSTTRGSICSSRATSPRGTASRTTRACRWRARRRPSGRSCSAPAPPSSAPRSGWPRRSASPAPWAPRLLTRRAGARLGRVAPTSRSSPASRSVDRADRVGRPVGHGGLARGAAWWPAALLAHARDRVLAAAVLRGAGRAGASGGRSAASPLRRWRGPLTLRRGAALRRRVRSRHRGAVRSPSASRPRARRIPATAAAKVEGGLVGWLGGVARAARARPGSGGRWRSWRNGRAGSSATHWLLPLAARCRRSLLVVAPRRPRARRRRARARCAPARRWRCSRPTAAPPSRRAATRSTCSRSSLVVAGGRGSALG